MGKQVGKWVGWQVGRLTGIEVGRSELGARSVSQWKEERDPTMTDFVMVTSLASRTW